jgi:hypothetical protein
MRELRKTAARERARDERLDEIRGQIADGSLRIRQATDAEREQFRLEAERARRESTAAKLRRS